MCTARLIAATVAACLFTVRASAHATLLSIDDPVFGPGSITLDTTTGLEWLDVPLSTNLTFAQVTAKSLPGGMYAGLRHATGSELTRLFQDAGIPVIGDLTIGGQQLNYPIAGELIALVGATRFQGTFAETLGFYDSAVPGTTADIDFFFSSQAPAYLVSVTAGSRNPSVPWPQIGHWLVREVPEPSRNLLLASGLLALMWRAAASSIPGRRRRTPARR
jgi:hypothetical protein